MALNALVDSFLPQSEKSVGVKWLIRSKWQQQQTIISIKTPSRTSLGSFGHWQLLPQNNNRSTHINTVNVYNSNQSVTTYIAQNSNNQHKLEYSLNDAYGQN